MDEFMGFPRQLQEFLLDLRVNNTIEMLEENKEKYIRNLSNPLKALHTALTPTVMEIDPSFDLKPTRCISPMYTDRRFAPKYPLREYVYLRFKVFGKKKDVPGLYFDMGLDCFSYGLRLYEQTAEGMNALREKVLKNMSTFNNALTKINNEGFIIKGVKYKKDHYPQMAASPSKELLNYRFFYIGKEEPLSSILYSEKLADVIQKGFMDLREVYYLLA